VVEKVIEIPKIEIQEKVIHTFYDHAVVSNEGSPQVQELLLVDVTPSFYAHAVVSNEGPSQVQELLLVDATPSFYDHAEASNEGSSQVQELLLADATPLSMGRDVGLGKRSVHEEMHVVGSKRNSEVQAMIQEFLSGKEPCGSNNPGEAYGDSHKSGRPGDVLSKKCNQP